MSRELKQVEAALAHDLNNFLQVIMGNLELLKRRGEFVPEIVDAGLQATRRAAQLADRFVAVARLRSPEPRRFDVNRALRDLEPLVARTVGDAVRVEFSPAPNLPEAFADPHALHVALHELATNARAAMPAGGRVAMRTAAAPEHLVMIEFADTGIGMPPAKAAQALAAPSWADGERPAGLGLQIVAGSLRQVGGRAELAADASGTRVKLYLPTAR